MPCRACRLARTLTDGPLSQEPIDAAMRISGPFGPALEREPAYDVDCPACASAALYLCRLCVTDFDPGHIQHRVDADGYLSQHRYSCSDCGLAVHRSFC